MNMFGAPPPPAGIVAGGYFLPQAPPQPVVGNPFGASPPQQASGGAGGASGGGLTPSMFDSMFGGGGGGSGFAPPPPHPPGGGAGDGGLTPNMFDAMFASLGGGGQARPPPAQGAAGLPVGFDMGKSYSSFLHGHPLELLTCTWGASLRSPLSGVYDCTLCGEMGNGATLACTACQPPFYAHPHCWAKIGSGKSAGGNSDKPHLSRGEYYQPAPELHPHKLQFVGWNPGMERHWRCGKCGTTHAQQINPGRAGSASLVCWDCQFDLCENCFRPFDPSKGHVLAKENPTLAQRDREQRPLRLSSVHDHPVVYTGESAELVVLMDGAFACRVCIAKDRSPAGMAKSLGAGPCWSCATCAAKEIPWACHLECLMDDGPGSDIFAANVLSQIQGQSVQPNKNSIIAACRAILPSQAESAIADPKARTALSPKQLAAQLLSFFHTGDGFVHPLLGSRAAPIWTSVQGARPSLVEPLVSAALVPSSSPSSGAAGAATKLKDSLRVAVFFDLYRVHEWMVDNRVGSTDANAVLWSRVLGAHAALLSGAKDAFTKLQDEGLLVVAIEDIPPRGAADVAFLTHRWDGVQGVSAMSVSFFQSFVFHQAQAAGYKPKLRQEDGALQPLWVWMDHLSIPQVSFNSAHQWSEGETNARALINRVYITDHIGLRFGELACKSGYFLPWSPLSFETDTNPQLLQPLRRMLSQFGMPDSFHIQSRDSLTKPWSLWAPLSELSRASVWQDRSYVGRIWCMAEYAQVYLEGLGGKARIRGAEAWHMQVLDQLEAAAAAAQQGGGSVNELSMSLFRSCDSHLKSERLERATKVAFACWQDNEPSVRRQADPFYSDQLSRGAISQHFLTLEGLMMTLVTAEATMKEDVPLVTEALYQSVLKTGIQGGGSSAAVDAASPSLLPLPLLRMRNWLLRQARLGLSVPAIAGSVTNEPVATHADLRADFLSAFEAETGALHAYINWVRKYIRQGFLSLLWLDALIASAAVLRVPDAAGEEVVDLTALLNPLPGNDIPIGYRSARHAYSWLVRVCGFSASDIVHTFLSVETSRSSHSWVALSKTGAKDAMLSFGNKEPNATSIQTDSVQFLVPHPDNTQSLLANFTVLKEAKCCMVYRVASSYVSQPDGPDSLQVYAQIGAACAVSVASLRLPPALLFSMSHPTALASVSLAGSEFACLLNGAIQPTDVAFPSGVACARDARPLPVWKIANHVREWCGNHVQVASNIDF